MTFLTNPNLAHLFVIVGVMLLMLSYINPKSTKLKVVMVLCLIAGGIEFVFLAVNPWAFLVLALSPLPFFIAVLQARPHNPLFLLSILRLTVSSVYLFLDQNNRPFVLKGPAGFVATLCGACIWIAAEGMRNQEGARLSNDPDSVVGLIGEVRTDIESHSAGSVLVEGELWQAHSKRPIRAGSLVRVLRQDGFWLTVKQVEKISKEGQS
jgi:membrane-bound serine protease (ClpP class)